MTRYLLSENQFPKDEDYYYEANYYTSDECYVHMHSHPYYEFYLFMSDGGKMDIDGTIYDINRGSLAIIPPYIHHTTIGEDNVKVLYEKYYLWITEHCLTTFNLNEFSLIPVLKKAYQSKLYVIHFDNEIDINTILTSFKALTLSKKDDPNRYGKELLNRAHILTSIVTINRRILDTLTPKNQNRQQETVKKIIDFINNNYKKEICLDTIATVLHINKFSISKLFKAETGITIYTYITKKRLEAAKVYMLDGIPPTKVFSLCGYKNYTSFF